MVDEEEAAAAAAAGASAHTPVLIVHHNIISDSNNGSIIIQQQQKQKQKQQPSSVTSTMDSSADSPLTTARGSGTDSTQRQFLAVSPSKAEDAVSPPRPGSSTNTSNGPTTAVRPPSMNKTQQQQSSLIDGNSYIDTMLTEILTETNSTTNSLRAPTGTNIN